MNTMKLGFRGYIQRKEMFGVSLKHLDKILMLKM